MEGSVADRRIGAEEQPRAPRRPPEPKNRAKVLRPQDPKVEQRWKIA